MDDRAELLAKLREISRARLLGKLREISGFNNADTMFAAIDVLIELGEFEPDSKLVKYLETLSIRKDAIAARACRALLLRNK